MCYFWPSLIRQLLRWICFLAFSIWSDDFGTKFSPREGNEKGNYLVIGFYSLEKPAFCQKSPPFYVFASFDVASAEDLGALRRSVTTLAMARVFYCKVQMSRVAI